MVIKRYNSISRMRWGCIFEQVNLFNNTDPNLICYTCTRLRPQPSLIKDVSRCDRYCCKVFQANRSPHFVLYIVLKVKTSQTYQWSQSGLYNLPLRIGRYM
mgnify:CR=1 FL=1